MLDQFSRTQLLLGKEGMERLAAARVAVFGVGGVGGYAVEALARSGVGAIDLIDNDRVSITNINRQIIATLDKVGMFKTDVACERIVQINPKCIVTKHNIFYMPDTADSLDFTQYDYIIDAIDTVTGKLEIIMRANAAATPVISSMGTGNKLDPTALEVADIYETSVCPLARVMRYELRKRGIKKLKVVYSKENPVSPSDDMRMCCLSEEELNGSRNIPGSTAFVPPVAGLIIAGEVIKDICR